MGQGIYYSTNAHNIENDNSYNDCLHAEDDGVDIFLTSLGFHRVEDQYPEHLGQPDAADYMWNEFARSLEW